MPTDAQNGASGWRAQETQPGLLTQSLLDSFTHAPSPRNKRASRCQEAQRHIPSRDKPDQAGPWSLRMVSLQPGFTDGHSLQTRRRSSAAQPSAPAHKTIGKRLTPHAGFRKASGEQQAGGAGAPPR